MSLAKINNFANDDTDILAVQTTVDALYQNSYSLTNYSSGNTTVPAIAAGSKVEVNGSLYRASSEESISTTDPVTSSTVANGYVYICMIPSGDASTCTAAFTSTVPTWSASKQGWYGTGGQANYKYLKYGMTKISTSYSLKHEFTQNSIYERHHAGRYDYGVTSEGYVYGYMTDGTPLYAKTISITISSGSYNNDGAHGISNALSSQRILSVCQWADNTTYYSKSSDTSISEGITVISYDNTNINLQRPTTMLAKTFTLFIVYR